MTRVSSWRSRWGHQNVYRRARGSATMPITNSTVPAVCMSNQLRCAVTAHFKIAPTAINVNEAPMDMTSAYPVAPLLPTPWRHDRGPAAPRAASRRTCTTCFSWADAS
jgi:hypothetical protein